VKDVRKTSDISMSDSGESEYSKCSSSNDCDRDVESETHGLVFSLKKEKNDGVKSDSRESQTTHGISKQDCKKTELQSLSEDKKDLISSKEDTKNYKKENKNNPEHSKKGLKENSRKSKYSKRTRGDKEGSKQGGMDSEKDGKDRKCDTQNCVKDSKRNSNNAKHDRSQESEGDSKEDLDAKIVSVNRLVPLTSYAEVIFHYYLRMCACVRGLCVCVWSVFVHLCVCAFVCVCMCQCTEH
jgi:hypothetical protein